MTTITSLPTVIRITSVTDAGEKDGATCPHCGASGRYIYHFDCVDGTHRAAMKICFSHFPKHEFVKVSEDVKKREAAYRAQGWDLPTYDVEIIRTIDMFAGGRITEAVAKKRITSAKTRRNSEKRAETRWNNL